MWMLIRWKAILAKANSKTQFIIYFESYEGWIDFYDDYQNSCPLQLYEENKI